MSSISATLFFISRAALFVNVTARIFEGITFNSFMIYEILVVNTFVFPLPAPAITITGPSVVVTASLWAGLRFVSKSINYSCFSKNSSYVVTLSIKLPSLLIEIIRLQTVSKSSASWLENKILPL